MNFENLLRAFFDRPVYQRLFLAFTLGLFISCGARMAGAEESRVERPAHAQSR